MLHQKRMIQICNTCAQNLYHPFVAVPDKFSTETLITKHYYRDDSLLLMVLLSQSLGDDFDHNVGLQPVICSD